MADEHTAEVPVAEVAPVEAAPVVADTSAELKANFTAELKSINETVAQLKAELKSITEASAEDKKLIAELKAVVEAPMLKSIVEPEKVQHEEAIKVTPFALLR